MSEPATYSSPSMSGGRPPPAVEPQLDAGEMGMLSFLVGEFFFFGALVFTYIFYIGASPTGPQPQQVLQRASATAGVICMIASGITLGVALRAVQRGRRGLFLWLLVITIMLGMEFIIGTGMDWHNLVIHKHFQPRTNLFSSNYYGLVGLHVLHVAAGIVVLLILLALARSSFGSVQYSRGVKLVSWYWYFIVGVAIAVYIVVYYGYQA